MSRNKRVRVAEERKELQARLKKRYPELLAKNEAEMCQKCVNRPCILLPVTTGGGNCPYFSVG